MTHTNKPNLYNKKKIGVYASSKHLNIPFCEQIAIIFDNLQRRVILSEDLYDQKEFEQAYHVVRDNISIASSLCDLLMGSTLSNNAENDAKKWQRYFTGLMQAFVLLSSNHNKQRKEKILSSLKMMSSLWRERGEELQEQFPIQDMIRESMAPQPSNTPFPNDKNVFLDA